MGLGTRAETLHVTRLGYRPKDVAFSLAQGTVTVNAEMQATAVALDQIVVTGTAGNQEIKAQSAVVATIDATDLMAKAPVLNVNELMYARTPGVSLTVASGASGANTRIDIRGQSSKSVDTIAPYGVEAVITLCADEVCPVFLGKAHRLHWALPDPAGAGNTEEEELQAFRDVRDELRRRLSVVFTSQDAPSSAT